MRILTTITLLFICSVSFAQTSFLKEAVAKLDRALVTKDTVMLKQLTHKDLTFGHSNGWVQSKEDIVKDLASGRLVYHKIESRDLKWTVNKEWTSVRSTMSVDVTLNGNRMELNLHVLEVWLKTNKGWQLIARQSTKL